MKKNITLFSICIILLIQSSIAMHNTDTVTLSKQLFEKEQILSHKNIELYIDHTNRFNLDSILNEKNQKYFFTNEEIKQSNKENINSTYWLRFYTKNSAIDNSYIFDIHSPNAKKITIYSLNSKNQIINIDSTGVSVDFEIRKFKDKNLLLNLNCGYNNETITHYVKVAPNGYCRFNFFITSYQSFMYSSKIEFICLGIFYGFILTMIIYNLILFFSTKDKVYPLYIGLLIMGTIRTLAEDRMGGLYLWSSNQDLSYILGIYIAPNAILIFYMLFTFNYLKIKPFQKAGKLIILSWLIYAVSYITLLITLGDSPNVTIFYVLPYITITYVSIALHNKKRNVSWYYLLGTIGFLLMISLSELRHQKIIFGGYWIVFSYHISLLIQSILFSFSIFDRLRNMQKNKLKLLKNAVEQDKTHFINLKKLQYHKQLVGSLKNQFEHILIPVNKIIEQNKIDNQDITNFKTQYQQLTKLINNLENESITYDLKQNIDIIDFSKNIYESFNDLANSKNIKLEFSTNSLSYICIFDQVIVEKMLFNLILNAINQSNKYEKVRLRIDAFDDSNKILFEIEDNGDGLSEDEIEMILNPISNKENTVVNSEIGIEFVKNLVSKINGEFNIESELHKGTLISVSIPYINSSEDILNKSDNTIIENEILDSININEISSEIIDKNLEQFITNATKIVLDKINDTELDVDDLCKGLGVSRAQLYRKFKSYKQLTVKEFVKEVRLKKAAELLIESNLNVNEIMYEVGFQNRQYFTKCFKEQFNETPSNYKSKMKVSI